MNLWTSLFVEISLFENDVAESQKCIDSNANYLLNIPKSARVYNWSLSSFFSTPDRLQQYSVVGGHHVSFIISKSGAVSFLWKLLFWSAIS